MDNSLLNCRGYEREYLRTNTLDLNAKSQALKDISKDVKLRIDTFKHGNTLFVDAYDVSSKYLIMSPKKFRQYIIIENEQYG